MITWLLASALAAGGPAGPAPDPATVPPSATGHGPQNNGKPHPVVARLLVDSQALPVGGRVRVGVHLAQEEGWHTYWKTPGEVGQPTEIAWTLPEGFAAGPQVFPLPERFEQDGMVSYGYDGGVLHVAELSVPPTAKPGPVTLAADVSWLVCKTSCIPGSAHVELPVQVVAGAASPSVHAPLFDAWAQRWPTPLEQAPFTVTPTLSVSGVKPESEFQAAFVVARKDGAPITGIDASKPWPTFTPIATGYDWAVLSSELRPTPDGRLTVLVKAEAYAPDPLPTGNIVGGLFQLKDGDHLVSSEVTLPVPWVPKDAAVTASADPIFTAQAPAPPATPPAGGPPEVVPMSVAAPVAPQAGLLANLMLAFVGGLILNVMPCVLPVLTLKIYGLVEEAETAAAARRRMGIAYTAGVLASFWALAGAVAALRAVLGMEVDWGFQFQYPPYVAALATIVFAFGLSLLGVFEIPTIGADRAAAHASREGAAGVFFSGVFATLLATPCSAPFLGSAIAYAFGAPSTTLFAIFTAVGLGLASPFLGVAFAPSLSRFLPRPGAWMDLFKQVMGFTLVGTTIWLFDVLMAQIGPDRATGFLVFLLAVGVGAWVFGRFGGVAESGRRQLLAGLVGAALAAAVGWWQLDLAFAEPEVARTGPIGELSYAEEVPWVPFSEATVAELDGKTVFIDFTAEWCMTCKVNEKTVLETQAVRSALEKHGVVPLKADWTRRDEIITKWLRDNGRAGVPMYLVIPADRSRPPILLPEVITPGMVTDALAQAAGAT